MSVNTTSTTAIQSSQISSTQATSTAKSTQKSDSTDFSKELKSADKTTDTQQAETDTTEVKDNDNTNVTDNTQQNSDSQNQAGDFQGNNNGNNQQNNSQETLQGMINIEENQIDAIGDIDTKSSILTQNIQELLNTQNQIESKTLKDSTPLSVDYNSINMSDGDAMFFVNLVENTDMSMQTIATQIQNAMEQGVSNVEGKTQVSATLMSAIQEGMKTNQPFRIDFDQDVSVILKIDKNGSLTANFIPGDKAVEQYLKNNIGFLRQRFDEENLSYNELTYSQSKNQQQERKEQKNKEKE